VDDPISEGFELHNLEPVLNFFVHSNNVFLCLEIEYKFHNVLRHFGLHNPKHNTYLDLEMHSRMFNLKYLIYYEMDILEHIYRFKSVECAVRTNWVWLTRHNVLVSELNYCVPSIISI